MNYLQYSTWVKVFLQVCVCVGEMLQDTYPAQEGRLRAIETYTNPFRESIPLFNKIIKYSSRKTKINVYNI